MDIHALTREQLKTIWYDEGYFDRDIASLFDVTVSPVKTLRKQMGILWQEVLIEERVKLMTTLERASTDIAATVESLSQTDRDKFQEFVEELSEWLKRDKPKE